MEMFLIEKSEKTNVAYLKLVWIESLLQQGQWNREALPLKVFY
jgi:hypothetical protein